MAIILLYYLRIKTIRYICMYKNVLLHLSRKREGLGFQLRINIDWKLLYNVFQCVNSNVSWVFNGVTCRYKISLILSEIWMESKEIAVICVLTLRQVPQSGEFWIFKVKNKIYFIKNSSWKKFKLKSERGDFNSYWLWTFLVCTLMQW